MSKLAQLREKRGRMINEAKAIVAKAETENRDLSAEEGTQVDTLTKEAEELGPQIARLEKVEKLADEALQPGKPKSPINAGDAPVELGGGRKPVVNVRHPKSKYFPTSEEAYSAGMFLAAVIWKRQEAALWCKEHGLGEYLAMSTDIDSKGGALVPPGFSATIIDLRNQYGVFRRRAKVHPMPSDTDTIPRRVGGLTVYAVNEGQAIAESDKEWNNVQLTVKDWGILTRYSNKLAATAIISMADDLAKEIAYSFSLKEDQIGFLGDGSSTYHRIMGLKNALAAGSTYTAASGNLSFGTLDLSDFTNALAKVPAYARANTAWYFSQAGWDAGPGLLMGSAGGNTTTNLAGKIETRFLGYPVEISEVLPTDTGNNASTILGYVGDLYAAATIGDLDGIAIASSEHVYFASDQIAIRGTARFDVNVHEVGTASAAGPIVAIKTPGS